MAPTGVIVAPDDGADELFARLAVERPLTLL